MLAMLSTILVAAISTTPAQDAQAVATMLLDAGAATFNSKDAAAMAATYAEDAELVLLSMGEKGFERRSYSGKGQIRTFYADLFSTAGTIRSKNVVEYARFIGPDLLLIAGTFEPDLAGALTLQFVQYRIRSDDGTWLIRELQVIPIPQS